MGKIAFPTLLFPESHLREAVCPIGKFLKSDLRTQNFTHPMYARACIEVNLSKPLPSRIKVKLGTYGYVWQKVVYESNIEFCSNCSIQGHTAQNCRKAITRKRAAAAAKEQFQDALRPNQPMGGSKQKAQQTEIPGNERKESAPLGKTQKVWLSKRQANKAKEVTDFGEETIPTQDAANGVDAQQPTVQGNNVERQSQEAHAKNNQTPNGFNRHAPSARGTASDAVGPSGVDPMNKDDSPGIVVGKVVEQKQQEQTLSHQSQDQNESIFVDGGFQGRDSMDFITNSLHSGKGKLLLAQSPLSSYS